MLGKPDLVRGYLQSFAIKRVLETPDVFRSDAEIELSDNSEPTSPTTTLRFVDARNVTIGDEAIDFGAIYVLSIDDVSDRQWDGVRFEVSQHGDSAFHLYCHSFEISRMVR
jgi:hypothetical protein